MNKAVSYIIYGCSPAHSINTTVPLSVWNLFTYSIWLSPFYRNLEQSSLQGSSSPAHSCRLQGHFWDCSFFLEQAQLVIWLFWAPSFFFKYTNQEVVLGITCTLWISKSKTRGQKSNMIFFLGKILNANILRLVRLLHVCVEKKIGTDEAKG